ncbi:protease-associated RING/U-box zinc finger-containing protein [Corchorus olitorius]|uniref:Protease-associated RING/U-box zinc finger-containing protein n=1 Tax=Corchorus olitorius TaxID=93759 RepID=A0A1R3HFE6_9ROSI|nr:protease-associated RING/U-box zinc finger-containing protein [Corchorus olitorius]
MAIGIEALSSGRDGFRVGAFRVHSSRFNRCKGQIWVQAVEMRQTSNLELNPSSGEAPARWDMEVRAEETKSDKRLVTQTTPFSADSFQDSAQTRPDGPPIRPGANVPTGHAHFQARFVHEPEEIGSGKAAELA